MELMGFAWMQSSMLPGDGSIRCDAVYSNKRASYGEWYNNSSATPCITMLISLANKAGSASWIRREPGNEGCFVGNNF